MRKFCMFLTFSRVNSCMDWYKIWHTIGQWLRLFYGYYLYRTVNALLPWKYIKMSPTIIPNRNRETKATSTQPIQNLLNYAVAVWSRSIPAPKHLRYTNIQKSNKQRKITNKSKPRQHPYPNNLKPNAIENR